ncbi:MAG: hypothetical protein ACLQDV_08420 [Candidatus Binataceae bacterium]
MPIATAVPLLWNTKLPCTFVPHIWFWAVPAGMLSISTLPETVLFAIEKVLPPLICRLPAMTALLVNNPPPF